MSVLACDRLGCEAIMCNRLILDSTVRLCEDCWKELKNYKATWPPYMPVYQVRQRIEWFMSNVSPGSYTENCLDDIDVEFERLTGSKE